MRSYYIILQNTSHTTDLFASADGGPLHDDPVGPTFFPDSVNADPEHLKNKYSIALTTELELIRTTGIGMLTNNQRHDQTVKCQCLAEDEHDELFGKARRGRIKSERVRKYRKVT